MTPVTCPVGRMPTSGLPSTIVALMSIGALAAIASWLRVRSWFRRMAAPSCRSSRTDVPVSLRKRSAASAARGKRNSRGDRSSRSTTSVRMTRCGAPSSAVVTTVSNTVAAV